MQPTNTFVLDDVTGDLQVSRNGLIVMRLTPIEQLELLAGITGAHVQIIKRAIMNSQRVDAPQQVAGPILDPTK